MRRERKMSGLLFVLCFLVLSVSGCTDSIRQAVKNSVEGGITDAIDGGIDMLFSIGPNLLNGVVPK